MNREGERTCTAACLYRSRNYYHGSLVGKSLLPSRDDKNLSEQQVMLLNWVMEAGEVPIQEFVGHIDDLRELMSRRLLRLKVLNACMGRRISCHEAQNYHKAGKNILMQRKTTAVGKIVILIVTLAAIAVAIVVGVQLALMKSSTTSTEHLGLTGSCYGLPGTCSAGSVFALEVNYTGPWKVTYEGYNSLGRSNTTTVSGSYSGSGYDSWDINVTGSSDGWTLCAQGQKLDASSFTLTISVGGVLNETSLPDGSTSTCQEAQIV